MDETTAIKTCVEALDKLDALAQKKVVTYLQAHADQAHIDQVKREADTANAIAAARDEERQARLIAEAERDQAQQALEHATVRVAALEEELAS